MSSKLFFLSALLFLAFQSSAQFVDFGQDRAGLRWKQINTSDFQIIYPDFFEENAQKAANIYARLYRHANTLGLKPKKISVILHANGGVSNGNVALAPRKTELYTMPPQSPSDNWLEHVCTHEFRHIVQMDKVNQGLTKGLYYLFGEIFPIAVVGVYVPMWFMEGDAVSFETAVGRLGRGRSPEFLDEMKAQVVEKGIYNYSKAVLGSYKDYVPNRYNMGYFMTTNSRINYGPDIWAKALERTGRRPFSITPFAGSLRKSMAGRRDSLWQDSTFRSLFLDPDSVKRANTYRDAKRTLYRDNFSELQQIWKQETSRPSPSFDTLFTRNKYYTNYYHPIPIGKDSVIAYKKGLAETGEFVLLSGGKEKRLTRTGNLSDYAFAYRSGRIVWSEYVPHVRWEQAGRQQLSSFDLRDRQYRHHKSKENRFAPFVVDRGWGCVEVDDNNQAYLVLLEGNLQQETGRIPAQNGELFIHPSYANGKITTVVQSSQGLQLASIDPTDGQRRPLTSPVDYELDHPLSSGDAILYRASYNTHNAFYRWQNGKIAEILSARYGVRYPHLSPDGQELYFSFYTADGYKPGKIARPAWTDQPVHYRQFRLADSLRQEENWQLTSQSDSVYSTRKYNKLTHLVNIHSWGPLYVDLYDGDIDFGAVVYSQNKLSTLSFAAGYLLKSGYEHGAWMLKGSYKAWWPIIDLEAESGRFDYTTYAQVSHPQQTATETLFLFNKAYRSSLKATLKFPFNLSTRQYSRGLQPYFRYTLEAVHHQRPKSIYSIIQDDNQLIVTPVDPRQYRIHQRSIFYQMLEYGLSFSNQTLMTTQEIHPRWGQMLSGGYVHTPLEKIDLGSLWWCDARLYVPGLWRNHSLSVYGGFQQMSDKARNFSNKIMNPRGIHLYGYEAATLRTSYQLPLLWPDLAIGPLLYLKSIQAGVFYDLGVYKNTTRNHTYSSYGVEFTTDTHAFRLTYPIRLGFRTGYETQSKKIFTDLIFSIGISI